MSGAVIIKFKNKSSFEDAKEWFKEVCPKDRFPDLPVPNNGGKLREEEIERGLYIEFMDKYYDNKTKYVINLEYAIWDDAGRIFADALGKEICKKFKVEKAGWESIGFVSLKEYLSPKDGIEEHFKRVVNNLKEDENEELIKYYSDQIILRKNRIEYYNIKAKELINA